jgi:hypothetical protein
MEFGGGESVISSRYPPLEASPRGKEEEAGAEAVSEDEGNET